MVRFFLSPKFNSIFRRLTANYAPYPDGNVPRQGLYFSYRRVCDNYTIPHINTATLGKAIRLCFPTIKTRRLGVRGNSKYHCKYSPFFLLLSLLTPDPSDCGIRPATTTEAEFLQDYIQKSNNSAGQSSINAARLANEQADASHRANDEGSADGDDDDDDSEGNHSANASKRNSLLLPNELKAIVYPDDLSDKTPTAATLLSQAQAQRPGTYPAQASIRRNAAHGPILSHVQPTHPLASQDNYMNAQSVLSVRQFPAFPSIVEAVGANSTSTHGMAAREVWNWFQDHLDALLDSMRTFRFDQFEIHLRTFWSNLTGHYREVVHAPAIAGLMAKADAIVYDVCCIFGCLQL